MICTCILGCSAETVEISAIIGGKQVIKYFDKEGYEADDLLATLASKAISHLPLAIRETKDERQKAIDVIILSSDRDVLQLVDGSIKVQMPSFAASAVQASKDKKATGVKEVDYMSHCCGKHRKKKKS